jgi:hypothetical protein
MNTKFEEDILSIGGNDPEKTLDVAQMVFKRLDVIAESIFLPDYMMEAPVDYLSVSLFLNTLRGELGIDRVKKLESIASQSPYTELHKDITGLFLSRYLAEKPNFLQKDRSTCKYLRIFHEKRMLYVADWFINRHLKNTDRERKYKDLELRLRELTCLHDRRVKCAAERVGLNGRMLYGVLPLNYNISGQRNEGFTKYCIDTGFSLMENELKPFLDEAKDWHDMIESPAYGSKGVCIIKYDVVYGEYFIERCLQIARDWDCSNFANDPAFNVEGDCPFTNPRPILPRLWTEDELKDFLS